MAYDGARARLARLLKRLRRERGMSQLHLADEAGVNPSVVHRAEKGIDARLSTWEKLFEGLGYLLIADVTELSEEAEDLLGEEAERRRERRLLGLLYSRGRY